MRSRERNTIIFYAGNTDKMVQSGHLSDPGLIRFYQFWGFVKYLVYVNRKHSIVLGDVTVLCENYL